MSFGKGLIQSAPAKTAHRLGATLHPKIAAALAAGPRGQADLTSYAPPALNQKNSNTCWSHSGATLLYTVRNILGKPTPLASPLYFAQCVYSGYRATMTPAGQPLGPLLDQGAELQDAANAFASYGEIPFQTEQQGGGTDVPATSDANGNPIPIPEMTPQQAQIGTQDLFDGEYAAVVDASAPLVVAAALDANIPVWIGTLVGPKFEGLQPGQTAQPTDRSEPGSGGHAMAILRYETVGDSVLRFRFRNSWGPDWCENGECWASAECLPVCWSIWPFAVRA